LPVSKITRLTDSSGFAEVYRRGVAYRGKLFSVHAFPNDLGTARLGLSVSKKVGNAVVRNTVRRRLREIFRAALSNLPDNLDFVVSARPTAANASFSELQREFDLATCKLGSSVNSKR